MLEGPRSCETTGAWVAILVNTSNIVDIHSSGLPADDQLNVRRLVSAERQAATKEMVADRLENGSRITGFTRSQVGPVLSDPSALLSAPLIDFIAGLQQRTPSCPAPNPELYMPP